MKTKNNNFFLKYTFAIIFLLLTSTLLLAQKQEYEIEERPGIVPPPEKTEEQKEKERKDSIAAIDNKWIEYFNETNIKLDNLYKKLSSIDADTILKVDKCEKELEIIKTKFKNKNYTDRLEDKDIEVLYDQYLEQISDVELKIAELRMPKKTDTPTNWLLIFGIAAGVLLMVGIPILKQILSNSSTIKTQKESEWQTMIFAQQIPQPQDMNKEHLGLIPEIENQINKYTIFIEKKPKKLHKKEAIERRTKLQEQKDKLDEIALQDKMDNGEIISINI